MLLDILMFCSSDWKDPSSLDSLTAPAVIPQTVPCSKMKRYLTDRAIDTFTSAYTMEEARTFVNIAVRLSSKGLRGIMLDVAAVGGNMRDMLRSPCARSPPPDEEKF